MLPLGWRDTARQDDFEAVDFAAVLNKPLKPSSLLDTLVSIFEGRPTRKVTVRERSLNSAFDATLGQKLPLQILVAEDNATNQKLALQMLQRLGYRADIAGNGLEVLEALARQRYDVVLMDVQMPEMDGLEATQRIRRQWPGELGPHIIAVTANALPQEREVCLAAGADDFVSKPIRVEALVNALQRCRLGEEKPGVELEDPNPELNGVKETPPENVLDPKALNNLEAMIGGDSTFLAALIDSFLKDGPQLLFQMHQALEKTKPADLKLAAHTLKSLANNFGATRLAKLCKELENLGQAGVLSETAVQIEQTEKEYEQVRIALETIRSESNDE
jgi:CheY-like chemotaxis protein/HPt (histidine-containing phosphotransfer) domain-containing protein